MALHCVYEGYIHLLFFRVANRGRLVSDQPLLKSRVSEGMGSLDDFVGQVYDPQRIVVKYFIEI